MAWRFQDIVRYQIDDRPARDCASLYTIQRRTDSGEFLPSLPKMTHMLTSYLQEARGFLQEATKGGQKPHPGRAGNHVHNASTARFRRQSASLLDAFRVARAISSTTPQQRSLQAQPAHVSTQGSQVVAERTIGSASASSKLPSDYEPPHIRAAKAARERRSLTGNDITPPAPDASNTEVRTMPAYSATQEQRLRDTIPQTLAAETAMKTTPRLASENFQSQPQDPNQAAEGLPRMSDRNGPSGNFSSTTSGRRTISIDNLLALNTTDAPIADGKRTEKYGGFECKQCKRWSCLVPPPVHEHDGRCPQCRAVSERIQDAQSIITGTQANKSIATTEQTRPPPKGGSADHETSTSGSTVGVHSLSPHLNSGRTDEGLLQDRMMQTAHEAAATKKLTHSPDTDDAPLSSRLVLGDEHAQSGRTISVQEAPDTEESSASNKDLNVVLHEDVDSADLKPERKRHASNQSSPNSERTAFRVPMQAKAGQVMGTDDQQTPRSADSGNGYWQDLLGLDFSPESTTSSEPLSGTVVQRQRDLKPNAPPFFMSLPRGKVVQRQPLPAQFSYDRQGTSSRNVHDQAGAVSGTNLQSHEVTGMVAGDHQNLMSQTNVGRVWMFENQFPTPLFQGKALQRESRPAQVSYDSQGITSSRHKHNQGSPASGTIHQPHEATGSVADRLRSTSQSEIRKGWLFDKRRRLYYHHDARDDCLVYEDGERFPRPSELSVAVLQAASISTPEPLAFNTQRRATSGEIGAVLKNPPGLGPPLHGRQLVFDSLTTTGRVPSNASSTPQYAQPEQSKRNTTSRAIPIIKSSEPSSMTALRLSTIASGVAPVDETGSEAGASEHDQRGPDASENPDQTPAGIDKNETGQPANTGSMRDSRSGGRLYRETKKSKFLQLISNASIRADDKPQVTNGMGRSAITREDVATTKQRSVVHDAEVLEASNTEHVLPDNYASVHDCEVGLEPQCRDNDPGGNTETSQGGAEDSFDQPAVSSDTVTETLPLHLRDQDRIAEDAVRESSPIDGFGFVSEEDHRNVHGTEEHDEKATELPDSKRTMKKKRKAIRELLSTAWFEREDARRRALGTSSLENTVALEASTDAYNSKRSELAQHSTNGDLNEEDALSYPVLSKTDLSAPKTRPPKASKPQDVRRPAVRSNGAKADENAAPDLNRLRELALTARDCFFEVAAYLRGPRPQGRTNMRELYADGKKRLERAERYYIDKRGCLRKAFPHDLWLQTQLPENLRRSALGRDGERLFM